MKHSWSELNPNLITPCSDINDWLSTSIIFALRPVVHPQDGAGHARWVLQESWQHHLQFMEVLHDLHGDSFKSDRWDQYIFVCGFPLIIGVEKTFLIRVSKAEAVDPGNASLYTPCTSMRNQDLAWYAQEVRHEAMPMCGLFRIWPVWKETTHSLGTRDKGNGTCTLYTFDAIYILHPA